MSKDSRIVQVSYKNTTKEMKQYLKVKSMEEQSQFVKDAIAFYLNYLEKEREIK